VRRAGGIPKLYPTLPDDYAAIRATLEQSTRECDFVISSGGASAGDFDFITDIAAELGQVFFKYVNMRPGKSQTFAMVDGTPFLGLAGNPAAAICGFELLVYPALQKMQGRKALFHPMQQAVLAKDVKKKGPRENYLRATLARDAQGALVASPYKNQSSALFGTLHTSDCLVVVPAEVNFLPAGSDVTCIHLDIAAGTVI
jgi:molybdopterin molybdotransferase